MAWILCAMGLIALAMCLVVLVSTAIKGHPGVGDEGCFLCQSEASAGIVPEDSLVIFEECDLHAVGEGSALVYRAPAGISLGRLYKTSNDYAAIIGADADTVTVVPSSAVLGVAALWEVSEYCMSLVFGTDPQLWKGVLTDPSYHPLRDTMWDIIVAIIGCAVFFVSLAVDRLCGGRLYRGTLSPVKGEGEKGQTL